MNNSPNKQKRRQKDFMKCKIGNFEFVKKKKKKKNIIEDSTSEEVSEQASNNNNVRKTCIILDSDSDKEEQHRVCNKTTIYATTTLTTPEKRKMKVVDKNSRNKENLESYSRNMNDIFEEFSTDRTYREEFIKGNVISISDEENSEQAKEVSIPTNREINIHSNKNIDIPDKNDKDENVKITAYKLILNSTGTSKLNSPFKNNTNREQEDKNDSNHLKCNSSCTSKLKEQKFQNDTNNMKSNLSDTCILEKQTVKNKSKLYSSGTGKLILNKKRIKNRHKFYKQIKSDTVSMYFFFY